MRTVVHQPLFWLSLHALALWPQWVWYWQRLVDGSDEPLGVIALLTLAILVARLAHRMRRAPDQRWLVAAGLLTLGSALAWQATPLMSALVGVLALAAGLAAWLPGDVPRLPYTGLLVLSLPLLSSLQFYGGYPLRVITAQLSCWILQLTGFLAERSGSSIQVSGHLVVVDAPCSGIQMAWMAYFAAFAAAAARAMHDRILLRRLPLVGLLVLTGNTLRNTILVAWEARGSTPGELWHQAIGLLLLAAVCLVVLKVMKPEVSRGIAIRA
ncbi:MAG TPA: exosortase Q [Steroidobacteraceae bacterium]|nr:exosortase Q [Steroidobacteraceae bacterium]